MKKTVSVNIKGLNFMIEEDAYEVLHQYMKRLENHLKGQNGAKDITEDIELRIAELCQSYLSDKKEVIEKEDIESIIKTLGQPEEFLDEEEKPTSKEETTEKHDNQYREKRLYRDVEEAKIAGICAGFANYFHVDVIVIRIVFLLFLFFGGFGFPLYIILWIVIPKAASSIDRLKMQGKAITVDSVMEEVEQAARRLGGTSKSFANHMRRDGSVRQRFGRIGNWLSNLVGLGLLGFGAFLLIVFVVFLLSGQHIIPLYSDQGYVSVSELGSLVFASEGDLFLAWLGGGIVASAVILLLISNGCYLLMRIRNRWTKLSSISLFLFGVLGVGICVYLGAITSTEFVYEEELEREVASVSCSELKLDVWNGNKKRIGEFEIKKGRNFGFVSLKKEEICNAGIEILYRKSSDSLYHIYQNFSADGKYSKQAMKRARNLNHKIHLEGNVLRIESYYHFPKKDKFRNQSVQVIIEIPKDKFVRVKDNRISVDYLEYGETEREGYLNYDGEFEYWY